MKISQSLIKEVQKQEHCPKQVYYAFVEGKDLIEPSENMILGRYFESELLGACRGGEKQEAVRLKPKSLKPSSSAGKKELIKYINDNDTNRFSVEGKTNIQLKDYVKIMPSNLIQGEKAKPFLDCDQLVEFAREVMKGLGLIVEDGESQIDVESETLKGAIDHRNRDIKDPSRKANYDVKWTATKEDDRWNGWGDPETKADAIIQAAHYTLVSYEKTGEWMPFYFLVFGKSKWVKVLQFVFDEQSIEQHKERIRYTSYAIGEHANNDFKGNGSFNKCMSCPFKNDCPDKALKPEIETINV